VREPAGSVRGPVGGKKAPEAPGRKQGGPDEPCRQEDGPMCQWNSKIGNSSPQRKPALENTSPGGEEGENLSWTAAHAASQKRKTSEKNLKKTLIPDARASPP